MQTFVRHIGVSVFVLTAALLLSAGAARPDTGIALAPGDTVSYSVIGVPELDKVSTIELNGQLQLPLVGWVEAAGLTIDGLRRQVASELSGAPVRTVGADGQEVWRQISGDLLFISVAAYRPLYLIGDVRENGEQPYRPGITLRQAVARAGGFGLPLSLPDSDSQLVSMAAERDLLAGEIGLVQATLARLEADLAAIGENAPEEPEGASAHGGTAARWLAARDAERQLSRSNSELLTQQMQNRLEVLQTLLDTHGKNADIEREALERAQSLADRGLTPASNVTEARRAVLQVEAQVLETSGEIHRLKLDLARTGAEVERLQQAQRQELLEQVNRNEASLDTLERRLAALDQRIAGLGGQSLIARNEEPVHRIIIHRQGEAVIEAYQLNDQALLPGDVLEIRSVFANGAGSAATQ